MRKTTGSDATCRITHPRFIHCPLTAFSGALVFRDKIDPCFNPRNPPAYFYPYLSILDEKE